MKGRIKMNTDIQEIKSILKKYNQEHLIKHYETLDENHKKQLIQQIKNIDFSLIDNLYKNTKKEEKNNQDEITPIEYLDKYKLNDE